MQNMTLTPHNPPPTRMKHLQSFLLLSLVAVSMSSCMVYDYPGGYYGGPVAPPVVVGTYASLPPGYAGDAYYYRNRYYCGGDYQHGRYNYGGRYYTDRYYHGGHYYYGGNHQHHGGHPRGYYHH